MKKCKVCKNYSIIKELKWINGGNKLVEVCINPSCKNYHPFCEYKWK